MNEANDESDPQQSAIGGTHLGPLDVTLNVYSVASDASVSSASLKSSVSSATACDTI